jgi:paraquat-inducible protein A
MRLYRLLDLTGRWSMLDVFVDTYVVALVRFAPAMSVEPGPGVVFFMAVVVLTMLAAQSFDPRLIWDSGRA